MARLYDLFVKYGTDKAVNGYSGLYEALFHGFEPRRLLEVGIGTMIKGKSASMCDYAQSNYQPGGSLRAWRDYFPTAAIVGLDVAEDTQFVEERINTHRGDSREYNFGSNHEVFDIIIDDGSHDVDFQISTLSNLWKHLRYNGFYIIEDVIEGNAQILGFMAPRMIGDYPWFFLGPRNNIMVIRKV